MTDNIKTENMPLNQNATIAVLDVQGYNQREIAKKIGVSHSTVSRRLNSDQVKQYQEVAMAIQLQNVERASQKLIDFMDNGEQEKIRFDATVKVMENSGIAATRTPIFIQNMSIDNRQQIMSTDMIDLLQSKRINALSITQDVIDIEPST